MGQSGCRFWESKAFFPKVKSLADLETLFLLVNSKKEFNIWPPRQVTNVTTRL